MDDLEQVATATLRVAGRAWLSRGSTQRLVAAGATLVVDPTAACRLRWYELTLGVGPGLRRFDFSATVEASVAAALIRERVGVVEAWLDRHPGGRIVGPDLRDLDVEAALALVRALVGARSRLEIGEVYIDRGMALWIRVRR